MERRFEEFNRNLEERERGRTGLSSCGCIMQNSREEGALTWAGVAKWGGGSLPGTAGPCDLHTAPDSAGARRWCSNVTRVSSKD